MMMSRRSLKRLWRNTNEEKAKKERLLRNKQMKKQTKNSSLSEYNYNKLSKIRI